MAFIFAALPAMGSAIGGLFGAGTAIGTAGAVGAGAGAAAGAGAGALGGGLTLGQIGSGLGAASSALTIGNKLFGSSPQAQAGRLQNIGGVGQSGNVNPFVFNPKATTAAPSVANLGGNMMNTFNQQNQPDFNNDQYGQQMSNFNGGGEVKRFDGLDGSLVDLDRVSYMDSYLANDNPTQNLITSQSYLGSPIEAGSVRDSIPGGFMDDKNSSFFDWLKKKDKDGNMVYDWGKIGMLGLGGAGLASLLAKPSLLPKYQPPTAQQYGLNARLASNYKPTRMMAGGGLTAPGILALNNPYSNEPYDNMSATDGGIMGGNIYPMSQQNVSQYAVPSQLPTGAHQVAQGINDVNINRMAGGGIADLGSYSDGGRMLKGPGDGMSDNIPATIAGKQPARLADGEFVMPADVVSHLGNGSTDAGAKKLYAMMDKVRKARTGTKKQGKRINPDKYLKV